ncbi:MAG: Gldg family protein [Anaerolineae bacterium]
MKRQILSITKKELSSYFGSPLATIFLGTFLAAVLFIFFTVETFFGRGIADVRPLFRWMPILLIFLLAALTMRQWSEEQRSGTQELLLTLPVSPIALVLGKFLAVMTLIVVALGLTLPLPITVSIIGNLDWGPVLGGYLAALLMASAYAAIGLFVSSRTDNQIVALIVTVLLGGLFYLLGTRGITDFVGGRVSELLWAVGTGSRFESIQRGVIDLRDLAYYLTLAAFFLMLNTVSLDSIRWSRSQVSYRRRAMLTALLIGLNLAALNVWLYPLQGLRLDLTAQKEYSLSQTTKDLFDSLQEPLLIRAYISENTHPLLAPLVPQIRDMLREYEAASGGRVTAEVVDPTTDPEIESEANQTYGIKPTPFQVAGRYEASVINAYFDILVRYGDQTTTLNFQDLIQVDATTKDVQVRLRNLEYDLTSSIKKVVFGFQSVDAMLAALDEPVKLTLYITPDTLPEPLQGLEETISNVAQEIEAGADGKFIYEVVNPDAADSPVDRQSLLETYGLRPIPVSLFSPDTFYAYMVLESSDGAQALYPPSDISEGQVRTTIESAIKRTSSGFLKVVGVWTPPNPAQNPQFVGPTTDFFDYSLIREQLRQEYTVRTVDLSTGQVPSDIDVLVVIAPQNMTDKELFAMDQFLMRGGALTLAMSNYKLSSEFNGGLKLQPTNTDNLQEWLQNYGITLSDSLVLDPQNQPFPLPVMRQVGNFQVQEIKAVDYPFFVDVRPDGMDSNNPIVANLPAVTLNWVSPAEVDPEKNAERATNTILHSSDESWLRSTPDIQPDYDLYPGLGFPVEGEQKSYPLAVSVQGTFESFFKDKPSPFEEEDNNTDTNAQMPPGTPTDANTPVGTIAVSPESSRLVVIGSAAFVEDSILNLSSRLTQDRYLTNLQFLQNVVDWSAEDLDLLAIRSRGSVVRVLEPLTEREQSYWEVGNYTVAMAALLGVYFGWRTRRRNEVALDLKPIPVTESGD